tara:strand:- start:371 stop:562 length:192 start_codon:yes stop_codon:yes gene_type:complete
LFAAAFDAMVASSIGTVIESLVRVDPVAGRPARFVTLVGCFVALAMSLLNRLLKRLSSKNIDP